MTSKPFDWAKSMSKLYGLTSRQTFVLSLLSTEPPCSYYSSETLINLFSPEDARARAGAWRTIRSLMSRGLILELRGLRVIELGRIYYVRCPGTLELLEILLDQYEEHPEVNHNVVLRRAARTWEALLKEEQILSGFSYIEKVPGETAFAARALEVWGA